MKKKTRKQRLSPREAKLLKALQAGKSLTDAALIAGYSDKHPGKSGHQALEQVKRRMPEIMDRLGLTDESLIEKYLIPQLEATETKFFAFRKTIRIPVKKKKADSGNEGGAPAVVVAEFEEDLVQEIQEREVVAWGPRGLALDIAFRLKGSYAPKTIDFDPDKGIPIKIDISAIPSHREPAE